jgi:hypothetical protein
MTQIEKVKALLINSPNGVCSTTFLKYNIPRFGHHVWTLRNDNWDIKTDKCDLEGHIHKDKQYKYIWSAIYKEDNPHNLDNEALQIEKDIDNAQQEEMNKEWEQYSREDKKAKIKQMMREAGIK